MGGGGEGGGGVGEGGMGGWVLGLQFGDTALEFGVGVLEVGDAEEGVGVGIRLDSVFCGW